MKKIDGLPVVNSLKNLTIHVIASDIKLAKRQDEADCAIAQAVRRECGAADVRIARDRAYVLDRNKKRYVRYRLGRVALREIAVFDRGGDMAPGEVELPRMGPAKSRNKTQGSNTNRAGKDGPKRMHPQPIPNIRIGAKAVTAKKPKR